MPKAVVGTEATRRRGPTRRILSRRDPRQLTGRRGTINSRYYGVRGGARLRGAMEGRPRVSEAENVEAPKNTAAGEADPAGAPGPPSRAWRITHILAAVLVAVVLPVVLIDVLVGKSAPTQ